MAGHFVPDARGAKKNPLFPKRSESTPLLLDGPFLLSYVVSNLLLVEISCLLLADESTQNWKVPR